MLFVEHRSAETPTATAQIGGRFVQFRGMTAEALPELVGTPRLPSATEGCVERPSTLGDMGAGLSEARLLEAGSLQVQAGDRSLTLQPRRFPELWNVVSGVVYAADEELPSDRWRFTAAGSADGRVAGFDVEAQAPEALQGVTLADRAWSPAGPLTLPTRPYAVRWTRGDAQDRVVLLVEPETGADRSSTLACTARDEGALELDAAWSERIAERVRAGARISLHRVRVRPFALAGFEQASIVFDWSLGAPNVSVD